MNYFKTTQLKSSSNQTVFRKKIIANQKAYVICVCSSFCCFFSLYFSFATLKHLRQCTRCRATHCVSLKNFAYANKIHYNICMWSLNISKFEESINREDLYGVLRTDERMASFVICLFSAKHHMNQFIAVARWSVRWTQFPIQWQSLWYPSSLVAGSCQFL